MSHTFAKKYIFVFFILLAATFLYFFIPLASAHSTGTSFEKNVDGFLIDIGYSEEEIKTDIPISFDFNLLNSETGEEVSYSDIWVIIKQDRDIYYAGGIHNQSIGATTMAYQFSEPGRYTLSVRFQNESESIIEGEFDMNVGGNAKNGVTAGNYSVLGYILSLIVGVLVGLFVQRFMSKKTNES